MRGEGREGRCEWEGRHVNGRSCHVAIGLRALRIACMWHSRMRCIACRAVMRWVSWNSSVSVAPPLTVMSTYACREGPCSEGFGGNHTT